VRFRYSLNYNFVLRVYDKVPLHRNQEALTCIEQSLATFMENN
jgi:hypothetical protein